jgi:hypothetical protein
MTPFQKELLFGWLMASLAALLALAMVVGFSGCAHHGKVSSVVLDSHLETATAISDRIDAKAVLVREWIQKN